ncbi:MAG: 3'-5' exonuclease [candidate division KSB1 bacterium]|nr:3'-5' exonuclease [candidate division KSB1 bacterium]MDZ7305172.1 3'-5' exonuclease [candidate division KSB1 bacterium]MDZ7314278.1 3'-5' exonuclease [candidate division KSB1 bacterium]
MRYLFLDTETDGLPNKREQPHLVSLTWCIVRPDGIVEKMENHIIRPDGFFISHEVTKIHGIFHNDALQFGKPCKEVLQRLVRDISFLKEVTIVGHNVKFDLDILKAELARHQIFLDFGHLSVICTMRTTTPYCKLPKRRGKGFKWPTLQELHFFLFGYNFGIAHSSKADVEATNRCFFELKRRAFYKIDETKHRESSNKKTASELPSNSVNCPPVVLEKYKIERIK